MAKYIDKQAFLDHMERTSRYFTVKFDIENFPAADVTPVVHGRWLDGKCTVCGWEEPDIGTWDGYDAEAWIETPYCPNCGAKMDGGVDDG